MQASVSNTIVLAQFAPREDSKDMRGLAILHDGHGVRPALRQKPRRRVQVVRGDQRPDGGMHEIPRLQVILRLLRQKGAPKIVYGEIANQRPRGIADRE